MANHNLLGNRAIVIKLANKGFENFFRALVLIMAWEIGAVSQILAGSKKEHLHARLAAFMGNGDDIGFAHVELVDTAFLLHIG